MQFGPPRGTNAGAENTVSTVFFTLHIRFLFHDSVCLLSLGDPLGNHQGRISPVLFEPGGNLRQTFRKPCGKPCGMYLSVFLYRGDASPVDPPCWIRVDRVFESGRYVPVDSCPGGSFESERYVPGGSAPGGSTGTGPPLQAPGSPQRTSGPSSCS